jgi:hypothetical protein
MKDLTKIWARPICLHELQPPLTTDMIRDAEEKLGYPLPAEYIELMKIQNGGEIRCGLDPAGMIPHNSIMGIGPNKGSINNNVIQRMLPAGLIPLEASIDYCLCLDYREDGQHPCITVIDGRIDQEMKVFLVLNELVIAENFREYLELLEIHTHETMVFETHMLLTAAIAIIAEKSGREFSAPGNTGGTIYYRTKLGATIDSIEFEVMPNKVTHYYYYDHTKPIDRKLEIDKRYPVDYTTQHPEVDENFLLINFNLQALEGRLFVKKMREAGYVLKPLKDYIK